jgi:hypothetical protein
MGPVRYLSQITTRVTASQFERAVDEFLALVLARLEGEGFGKNELAELWSEVNKERRDPKLAQWRKLEALCGCDPDEGPAPMIERLINESSSLGARAMEELAAHGRQNTALVLNQIQPLAMVKEPGRAGFRAILPNRCSTWKHLDAGERPWRRASAIAKKARKHWGLEEGPISNHKLAELVQTNVTAFTRAGEVRTHVPVAFRRGGSESQVNLFFHSLRPTGHRFAAGRLLGDHCSFASSERLIPETEAKTARQQFQRAFAQEFLCPFDALKETIATEHPDEEDIAKAADHFGVSPLLVRTTLVNKGELDRQALAWSD